MLLLVVLAVSRSEETMEPQPMRNLNAASAKAGTWLVRVVEPTQGSFWYGPASIRQQMHTFDCTLLNPDAAWYMQGALKSPKLTNVTDAKGKFLEGSLWKMSKVAFDSKAKSTFISAPVKHVVMLSSPTKFEAVLANSVPMPLAPVPQTLIANLKKLKEAKMRYDVAGVLVSGPTNERSPNTKDGIRRAADFQLVQRPKNDGDDAQALDFTAWENFIQRLQPLVGKYVALFKLEVVHGQRDKFTCETTRDAFVAELQADQSMSTFIESQTSGAGANRVVVTSKWQPSEPAFDVTSPQPLVCASFLRHSEKTLQTTGKQTWQVCACYLDKPTGNIHTQDGRLWFNSSIRDFSGGIEVGVTEAAALQAANVRSRDEFEQAFATGALQFSRCNVRGGRALRDGEVRYTIIQCESTQDVLPLTVNARALYGLLRVVGRTGGGVVATALRNLEADSCTGLMAAGLPVQKALLLVQGLERSKMEKLDDQRKMVTSVKCIFDAAEGETEAPRYKVVAFCHEDCVADYKFDKGQALVLATGISLTQENPDEYEVLAESITIVLADNLTPARDALHMQTEIAMSMVDGGGDVTDMTWEETPPSKSKRCRSIGSYPSDA